MLRPLAYIASLIKAYFLRRGPLLARGIAFSFLVGAVPLLVLVLYGTSTLYDIAPQLRETVVLRLDELMPAQVAQVIQNQAAQIASHSWTEIGLVTLIIIIFIAQGVFASLESGLSIIMRCPQERHIWLDNLLYMTLTILAIMMFFAASYIHVFLNLFYDFAGFPDSLRWIARKTTSVIIIWLALVTIYRACYHGALNLWVLFGVSFLVASLWQLLNWGASSVIAASGQREFIYGFLASMVMFMLWAYMFAVLLLFGGIIIARHSRYIAIRKGIMRGKV